MTVPLADSLSSYKLVAIATAGDELFGTGSTTIRTAQDLSLYSGVPPLVRTGDYFGATCSRCGTAPIKPMTVTANVDLQPAVATGPPLTVTIPAGGAVPVAWRLTAPPGIDELHWIVSARSADGRATDKIAVDEQVVPAVPEEVWGATYLRIGNGAQVPVAPPAGALPGRGGVEVALSASPAPPLAGVRAYMLAYPYGCFEQRLSKAVALDDRKAWDQQVGDLPTYMADERAAPLLAERQRARLDRAHRLRAVDHGRGRPALAGCGQDEDDRRDEGGGRRAAATRKGRGRTTPASCASPLWPRSPATAPRRPAMLGQAAIPVGDMPTAMLADWLVDARPYARRQSAALRAAAEAGAARRGSSIEGTPARSRRPPRRALVDDGQRRRDGDQGACSPSPAAPAGSRMRRR